MSETVMTEVIATTIVATTSAEVSPPLPEDVNRNPAEAHVPVIPTPAPVSKTERIRSFFPSVLELRRFGGLMMLSITILSCYHAARLKFYDTRDYYAYQGTVGPYEYVENSDGIASLGRPVTTIQPGQRIAWKTDFCTGRNVSLTVDFELVRLAEAGTPEITIDRRHSVVTPLAHRCGPAVNSWPIPMDSVPGIYEVRRTIVIRDGTWIPFLGNMFRLAETIDPVRVIVSYTAQPVMPPSQSQAVPEHSVFKYNLKYTEFK